MPGTFVFKPIEATINGRATIGFNPENLDPYCKVKVGNVALNTHPSRNFGPHPQWTDDLVVQQGEDNYCTVTVKDKNKGTLGEVKLNLDEIESKGKVAQWYNIYKDKNVQGQLMLEVVYTNANPQSRSWLQSSREGAAIATNNTPFIKGHHVSTAEIPHFRVPTTVHSHTAEHQMADIRKHLGANNIVARYALEHLKAPEVPEDHTAIKHEIERQNVKALNSSHKKTGNVVPRQYSPSERPSTVTTTPSKSQVDKLVHSTVREVANIKAHQDQLRIHPILKANDQEILEASQHVPQISDTKRVNIIDKVEPATRKDVTEVAKHIGQPGHFAGHSSLKKGNVRVQRDEAGTGPLVYPVIESNLPEIVNPGYAHAGHSSLQAKGHSRVERDETGVSVVYPKVDYVEDVYDVPVQSNNADVGHAHAGHASLQQHGHARVQRPNVYDIPQPGIVPGTNWVSHVQDNYAVGNNAHAGHSSLQAKGHARVERDETGVSAENVYNAPAQSNSANSGYAHAGHASLQHGHVRVQAPDVYDAASICSGCTDSSCSTYEGASNPNTVGMTREALKGVDRFNRQERQFNREYGSLVSGFKPGKKDDYWYLNSLGLSDPNTAKLGVNHRADRLGLADQKHHHHHHHHHHGHGGVVENPTLADINSLGSGARVRKY